MTLIGITANCNTLTVMGFYVRMGDFSEWGSSIKNKEDVYEGVLP
ncbi:hypothetical protein [Alkalihalobacillus sp. TS-13]|nr:hypothetical protein [Alkalihalobacillus sp. TS-13]